MNGVPQLLTMRSISLYGLSDVILTFEDETDNYFAREVVFQRLADLQLPSGVTPSLAPLFSPSGLVYRYVLESPDRSPQELHTIEEWVVERQFKSVPGVADDSGLGGTEMQYQVLLDPARLYGYHQTVPQVVQALSNNNSNAGGGFYSQGGQFYYVRGLGLLRDTRDIGNVVVSSQNGAPVRVHDMADVTIGNAPRLGQFGFVENDDAVEGVILMRRGEQTQTVLKRVEAKTDELNRLVLPKDVKIHPYYDRSGLVALTTDTVEAKLLRGMVLVLVVLIFFLFSMRAAIITALTIPLALLFAFVFLHLHDVSANLLSIGAIDFGILIDGTIVMMENIYRELALREGERYDLKEVILLAARDVDRPVFYSVAVIIAGYLPIYALTGPSGKLFDPMADTMAFGLIGAPHSYADPGSRTGVLLVQERRQRDCQPPVRVDQAVLWRFAGRLSAVSDRDHDRSHRNLRSQLAAGALDWWRVHAPPRRRRIMWSGPPCPTQFHLRSCQRKIAPQVRTIFLASYPQVGVVASELGRPDDGTDPTGFFNCEFYVELKPYKDKTWQGDTRTKDELIESIRGKLNAFPGIIFNFTQPAEDAVDEALTGLKSSLAVKVYGPDLPACSPGESRRDQRHFLERARIYGLDRGSGARPAESFDRCRPG